jgi:nitrous oxide reductase accessory protein NosL
VLYILAGGVVLFGLVMFSILCVGAQESREEEHRKPFAAAEGDRCRICGVLASVHEVLEASGVLPAGHRWSA